MKIRLIAAVFVFASVLAAHHSVPAEYDISKTITIRGSVTKIEWTNPHARLLVDAKNDDGAMSTWEMELPAPSALIRDGIKRDLVILGDQVTMNIWQAKDGSRLAHVLTLTLPDGRVLNFPRNWGPMLKIQGSPLP
jgi:Family of unknown function (DUF6152)